MCDGSHLGVLQVESSGRLWWIVWGRELPRRSFGVIDDGVRRNPQQPRRKWHASPLITPQVGQPFVEHVRGHIFRGRTVSHPACHERIHALEMQFIQSLKLSRILLRRFHEHSLVASGHRGGHTPIRAFRQTLPCWLWRGLHRSNNITADAEKGYAGASAQTSRTAPNLLLTAYRDVLRSLFLLLTV
jgi:hypothetical protein